MKRNIFAIFFVFVLFFPLNVGLANDRNLDFFYSPHCNACIKVKQEVIPKLVDKYTYYKINMFNIEEADNINKLMRIGQAFGKDKVMVPAISVDGKFFVGSNEIENIFEYLAQDKNSSANLKYSDENFDAKKYFHQLPLFTIVSAGLVDGINPCAFAVIVFFISFLNFYSFRKRAIVFIGLGYILAVFISYFLIGFGVFNALYRLKGFYLLMKIFYVLVGTFCFAVSGLSFYDYYKFKKFKTFEDMSLQLPQGIKNKIRLLITSKFRNSSSGVYFMFLVSFFVGISVSLLEAVCTGQVYVPIITMIIKDSWLSTKAWLFFLIYNIMFIIPLIVIFVLSLWGVSSENFKNFMKNNFSRIKIILGLLFLVLGGLMIWNV